MVQEEVTSTTFEAALSSSSAKAGSSRAMNCWTIGWFVRRPCWGMKDERWDGLATVRIIAELAGPT